MEKKSRLVAKYESYYRELKRSVELREQEKRMGLTTGASNTATATSSASSISTSGTDTATNTGATNGDTSEDVSHSTMRPFASPAQVAPQSSMFGPTQSTMPRHKHPTTSTLEASLLRSAALEKKERKK